ncbi:FkbM family methyltransferase [Nocardioides daedukensis]|uniref:FkbM family methyltransferase n=1 Tax=Nocardioides daedukensis TaxID=634462 RepID=A0A7Y9S4W9_9ACTN|nr:FkbM family methyltransferase [Nocardioides daedukensis]NYG59799.1 FkbM family methyltransferase [Nocardioides daedukensis]
MAGRQRLAKLARLVTDEVRLDTANDLSHNGESEIQRAALTDPNPTIFDVGAHFGEWSGSLLSQPGSTPNLHMFEPSASTSSRARNIVGDRGQVHQVALSDHVGAAELQIVHEGAGSNSLVPFTAVGRTSGVVEEVELSTVDAFADQAGIPRITLLKIDAEGHDLAVMRGATRMLSRQAVDLIQFEYNIRWIDSRVFLLDAFELLMPFGYSMGKVTSRGVETYPTWHPTLETFREGNYLAYQPSWADRLRTFDWWGG